ncbi:MAG TPA: hypothetical protein VF077_09705 [Nitrospiraceae bacterium]
MIGEGISFMDLMQLGKAVKDKELTLQIKVLDGEWKNLDKQQFGEMLAAIVSGKLTNTSDIRARLYSTKP